MSDITTARIFYDADADPGALADKTVAVVGYGSPGRSQALNIRGSGVTTIVGNFADDNAARARADGFAVHPISDACARADVTTTAEEPTQERGSRRCTSRIGSGSNWPE